MIGDLYTVALVGRNGFIDWCCLPDFDSPSVFGALLDAEKGGSFRLAPVEEEPLNTKQMYFPETNILVTRFLTGDGVGEITDFMPIKRRGSGRYEHHLVCAVHLIEQEELNVVRPDQVKLCILDVGICGTDKEICTFAYSVPHYVRYAGDPRPGLSS
jgi:GH15 family glucan-1,4-alpha-glucosidase